MTPGLDRGLRRLDLHVSFVGVLMGLGFEYERQPLPDLWLYRIADGEFMASISSAGSGFKVSVAFWPSIDLVSPLDTWEDAAKMARELPAMMAERRTRYSRRIDKADFERRMREQMMPSLSGECE